MTEEEYDHLLAYLSCEAPTTLLPVQQMSILLKIQTFPLYTLFYQKLIHKKVQIQI